MFIYLKAQATFLQEIHSQAGERERHKRCKEKKIYWFPRKKEKSASKTVLVTKIYFLSWPMNHEQSLKQCMKENIILTCKQAVSLRF